MRRTIGLLLIVALVSPEARSPAIAEPIPASPLVGGSFCSAEGTLALSGSSLAGGFVAGVLVPALASQCPRYTVTYTGTGNGAGRRAFLDRKVQIALVEDALTLDEQACATVALGAWCDQPGRTPSPVHHMPAFMGAVDVVYNLGACGIGHPPLRFRSQVLALIYSGLITRWNDPLPVMENAWLAGCDTTIKPVVRQDGSGTTTVFKDYLSKRNPWFHVYKQATLNTAWPMNDLGIGSGTLRAQGNGGVAQTVKAVDGAIGYIDHATARALGMSIGWPDGPHGNFVSPESGGRNNCAQAPVGGTHPPSTLSPGWDQVTITDSANPFAYPICTIVFALVYNNLKAAGATSQRARIIADVLFVLFSDELQGGVASPVYAPIPSTIRLMNRAGLATLTDAA